MRYLREFNQKKSAVDEIDDPTTLAHSIMDVESARSEREYKSYLWVSDVYSFCPREKILGYREKSLLIQSVPISLQYTFDIGNAHHHWLQNDKKYFGDKRIGYWECRACGDTIFGRPQKSTCRNCNAFNSAFVYKEARLFNEKYRVSGKPDLFLEVEKGDIRIVEIKSMNTKDFKEKIQPAAATVYQLMTYMELIDLPIDINRESGFVIHSTKDHQARGLPFKAFHVKRDNTIMKTILNDLAIFAKAIKDGIIPPKLPDCVRSSFLSTKAKYCQMKNSCMKG